MDSSISGSVALECPGLIVTIFIDSDPESDNENEMVFQVICQDDDQYKIIKTEVKSKEFADDGQEFEIKMDIGEEQCQESIKIKVEQKESATIATVKEEPEDLANVEIKEAPCESKSVEIKEEPLELANVSTGMVVEDQKESLNTNDYDDTLLPNDLGESATEVLLKTEITEPTSVAAKSAYKKCPHCTEKFKDNTLRKQHIRNHTLQILNVSEITAVERGVQQLKCRQCEKTWSRISKISMQKHALKHGPKGFVYHDGREYTQYACPECNQTFARDSTWFAHIRSSHDFFDFEVLNKEMSTPDGERHCRECGKHVPATAVQMQSHKLLHMPHKSFICQICGERKHWFIDISQHIRRKHFSRGQFQCIVCKKILETHHLCWQHCRMEHKLNLPNLITKLTAKHLKRPYNNAINNKSVVKTSKVTDNNCNLKSNESQQPNVMERIALRRQARFQYVNELKQQTTRVIKAKKVKRKQLVWNWSDDAGAAPEHTLSCTNISKELENMYKQGDIVY